LESWAGGGGRQLFLRVNVFVKCRPSGGLHLFSTPTQPCSCPGLSPTRPFFSHVEKKGCSCNRRLRLPWVTLGSRLRLPWVTQSQSQSQPREEGCTGCTPTGDPTFRCKQSSRCKFNKVASDKTVIRQSSLFPPLLVFSAECRMLSAKFSKTFVQLSLAEKECAILPFIRLSTPGEMRDNPVEK
jgi:hypothetical protein